MISLPGRVREWYGTTLLTPPLSARAILKIPACNAAVSRMQCHRSLLPSQVQASQHFSCPSLDRDLHHLPILQTLSHSPQLSSPQCPTLRGRCPPPKPRCPAPQSSQPRSSAPLHLLPWPQSDPQLCLWTSRCLTDLRSRSLPSTRKSPQR